MYKRNKRYKQSIYKSITNTTNNTCTDNDNDFLLTTAEKLVKLQQHSIFNQTNKNKLLVEKHIPGYYYDIAADRYYAINPGTPNALRAEYKQQLYTIQQYQIHQTSNKQLQPSTNTHIPSQPVNYATNCILPQHNQSITQYPPHHSLIDIVVPRLSNRIDNYIPNHNIGVTLGNCGMVYDNKYDILYVGGHQHNSTNYVNSDITRLNCIKINNDGNMGTTHQLPVSHMVSHMTPPITSIQCTLLLYDYRSNLSYTTLGNGYQPGTLYIKQVDSQSLESNSDTKHFEYTLPHGSLYTHSVHPHNNNVLLGTSKHIKLYDIYYSKQSYILNKTKSDVLATTFINHNLAAAGSRDHYIRLYDTRQPMRHDAIESIHMSSSISTLYCMNNQNSILNDNYILCTSHDGCIELYDIRNTKQPIIQYHTADLEQYNNPLNKYDISHSQNNHIIFASRPGGIIHCYNTMTGELIHQIQLSTKHNINYILYLDQYYTLLCSHQYGITAITLPQ